MKVFAIFVILCSANSGLAQNLCVTPNGENGVCILFENCEPFTKIWTNRTYKTVQFVRSSHCGFQNNKPLVCCGTVAELIDLNNTLGATQQPLRKSISPQTTTPITREIACTTPNGEQARCIPVKQCQVIKDAFINGRPTPDVANFIRESNCGYSNGPWVCCGSVHHYISRTVVQTSPLAVSESDPNADPKQHKNYNLLPSKCGLQDFFDGLTGKEADLEEFPWMALIEYKNRAGKRVGFSCGGILISSRYVLTAAHCITGRILREKGTPFSIRVGEHDQRTEKDCRNMNVGLVSEVCSAPYQDVEIEQAIPHANFDEEQVHNDIGLLRLKNPVEITSSVRPICLPLNGERSGKRLMVAGWGKTKINNTYIVSPIKLKVTVPVVSNSQCNNVYRPQGRSITDNQFCAGGEPGVDSCIGDSGWPAMITKGLRWYVEGILTWRSTKTCGEPGYPGVYTRVAAYNNWILDNMA